MCRGRRVQLTNTDISLLSHRNKAPIALTGYAYQEIHHNNNPFILRILPKEAKTCKQCPNDFCHHFRIIPTDLVFQHVRFYYPLNGDRKKKQASTKEARRRRILMSLISGSHDGDGNGRVRLGRVLSSPGKNKTLRSTPVGWRRR